MNILLVEDDSILAKVALTVLSSEGYIVHWSETAKSAKQVLEQQHFDVVLLDLILPDEHGHSVLSVITEQNINTPVIVLTSDHSDKQVVSSLNLGADDYITKPFNPVQLLARINAVVRRYRSTLQTWEIDSDLIIDLNNMIVERAGKPINLTLSEYKLLKELASQPGTAFSREQLVQLIASKDDKAIDSNSIDVHIHSLRKKLNNKQLIKTERGVGYSFNA
ncbi:response regulator transcription factor [Catenovulum sp. SM1970]|uniref:response regulator transcription factor n=1 Tax=Marinifaba aquimaris TaxID=2741323 RepID=UPI001574E797|nr:response regulator transcription factor [Marinifaba aquimaris]NTS75722.1 response regulator transcription factor [Marinifaba aquimaris]